MSSRNKVYIQYDLCIITTLEYFTTVVSNPDVHDLVEEKKTKLNSASILISW